MKGVLKGNTWLLLLDKYNFVMGIISVSIGRKIIFFGNIIVWYSGRIWREWPMQQFSTWCNLWPSIWLDDVIWILTGYPCRWWQLTGAPMGPSILLSDTPPRIDFYNRKGSGSWNCIGRMINLSNQVRIKDHKFQHTFYNRSMRNLILVRLKSISCCKWFIKRFLVIL